MRSVNIFERRFVDVSFPISLVCTSGADVRAGVLASDHGYPLYAAIKLALPGVTRLGTTIVPDQRVGWAWTILPLQGTIPIPHFARGRRRRELQGLYRPRSSDVRCGDYPTVAVQDGVRLVVRCPDVDLGRLLTLVDQVLDVLGLQFSLEWPTITLVEPVDHLFGKVVGWDTVPTETEFVDAVADALDRLGVSTYDFVSARRYVDPEHVRVQIRDDVYFGFNLGFSRLPPAMSMVLQKCGIGIGGFRRHMGTGFYRPPWKAP